MSATQADTIASSRLGGIEPVIRALEPAIEAIAWPEVHSPDSDVETPVWVARSDNVPAYETPVTIRITPVAD